jgi:hypothetical protein
VTRSDDQSIGENKVSEAAKFTSEVLGTLGGLLSESIFSFYNKECCG